MKIRNITALIIAPLMPALLHIVVPVILTFSWPFNGADIKIILYVAIVVSYVATILLGIPLLIVLKKSNKLRYLYLNIFSFILGGLVMFIFAAYFGASMKYSTFDGLVYLFFYGGILAASVAFVYGLISGITSRPKATRNRVLGL